MRTLLLTVLLTILTLTTSADETTTNNLLSQDFSTGWSGTATQRHGNSVVASPSAPVTVTVEVTVEL